MGFKFQPKTSGRVSEDSGFIPVTSMKKASRAAAGKGSAEGQSCGRVESSGQKPPSEGPPLKPETLGPSGAGLVSDAARSAESEALAATVGTSAASGPMGLSEGWWSMPADPGVTPEAPEALDRLDVTNAANGVTIVSTVWRGQRLVQSRRPRRGSALEHLVKHRRASRPKRRLLPHRRPPSTRNQPSTGHR